jgi:hypothetical protein
MITVEKTKQQNIGITEAKPSSEVQRFQWILEQKRDELACRRRDLSTPYYADDEWVKDQISRLGNQIAEMERYLKDGGELNLPYGY